jgi:hypothetical protein
MKQGEWCRGNVVDLSFKDTLLEFWPDADYTVWSAPFKVVTFSPFEGVTKSLRTGRLDRELQMVQLSATRCNFNAIMWVSLVSFAAITLCVDSQRVFIVVAYFVIGSVRKFLYTPSYMCKFLSRFTLYSLSNWKTLSNKRLINHSRPMEFVCFTVMSSVPKALSKVWLNTFNACYQVCSATKLLSMNTGPADEHQQCSRSPL